MSRRSIKLSGKSNKFANRGHRALISVQAAADYCDVDTRTVRRWIAAGRLNALRVGPRLIKIDVSELDKMMAPVGGGAV
jgi:excisionase family DNA binding protein